MSAAGRLLEHLPAIYRQHDTELAALLAPFESLLFDGEAAAGGLPGIARELDALPLLFAPLGAGDDTRGTPERFLHWLAAWLQFAPHGLVAPERLRQVLAGIVPLYARRGTRDYLVTLLRLCFEEVETIEVSEHDGGLHLGHSRIGQDSLLATERPFWFRVQVGLRGHQASDSTDAAIERRLRAVIDFAKPAHTAYELSTAPCRKSN